MSADRSRELRRRLDELRGLEEGTELLDVLEDLFALEFREDPAAAADVAREALEVAMRLGLDERRAVAHRMIGVSRWGSGDYAGAVESYGRAMRLFTRAGDRLGVASVSNNMGAVFQEQGMLDLALEHYLTALRIKESRGDLLGTANPYLNIGNIYRRLERYREALYCYSRAMEIWDGAGDERRKASSLCNIGLVHNAMGEHAEAMEQHERALRIRERSGDRRGIAICLGNIGRTLEDMGDLEGALERFRACLALQEELEESPGMVTTMSNMGDVLLGLGRLDEAEEVLEGALKEARRLGMAPAEATCHRLLSELSEERGDLAEALAHYKSYSRVREGYMTERSRERLAKMQVLFETSRDMDHPDVDSSGPGREPETP